jgi:uncharacterized protein (DUF952 family)/protein-tyrosine phosphatase
MIYHITKTNLWEKAQTSGQYLPAEFDRDGFIHASEWYQLKRTANLFYPGQPDLIVLEIETVGTNLPLVYENLDGGNEPFPHIYGPLPTAAVADTFTFDQDADGRWQLPVHKQRHSPPGPTLIPLGTPGKLYRSSMPFSSMFDREEKIFNSYLELGVEVVVVLNEAAEIQRFTGRDLIRFYEANGVRALHTPIADFSAPQPGVWNKALGEVELLLQSGKTLAVHCHAGIGRTGMFIACLAQDLLGLQGEESISWVRTYIPSAVETEYQRQFVLEFQANKTLPGDARA